MSTKTIFVNHHCVRIHDTHVVIDNLVFTTMSAAMQYIVARDTEYNTCVLSE